MEYDSYNRIVRVSNPDAGNEVVGRYKYDDQGFRVARISKHDYGQGKKEYMMYYPSKFMCMEIERDENGREVPGTYTVMNNIYLNGRRIAAMLPNGEAQYYLTDQVESVKYVVDDRAMVKSRYEYQPYGEKWFTEGSDDSTPMYGSKEFDEESGLYFFGARYYNPATAHFASADSVIDGARDTQGWNRYMYCKGNPIYYSDPSGHVAWGAVGEGIKRSAVDSITYKYTNQEGGRKGVIAAMLTNNLKVAEIRYNRTNGWSIKSQVVNYYGAYIGWGWQQRGENKGFNVFTGGGASYGYANASMEQTYYFGSNRVGHFGGIGVAGQYGYVGIGYNAMFDTHGNKTSSKWNGYGGVNYYGIGQGVREGIINNNNSGADAGVEGGKGGEPFVDRDGNVDWAAYEKSLAKTWDQQVKDSMLLAWYIDKNFSVNFIPLGNPYVLLGITWGFVQDEKGNVSFYIGASAGTPGYTSSLTASPSNISPGANVGLQETAVLSGQVGYGFGDNGGPYYEIGTGWPMGGSASGFWIFKPIENKPTTPKK